MFTYTGPNDIDGYGSRSIFAMAIYVVYTL